jgi:hypothetical protein
MVKTVSAEDLRKLPHRYQVMFAVFCAEQVIGLVKEQDRKVCLKAIEVTRGWLRDEVTTEECKAVARAAHAATCAIDAAHAIYATCAAGYAAAAAGGGYAACAADAAAAAYTAYTADAAYAYAFHAGKNRNKVIKEQWNYYYDLLNLDENLEKILVG